jgi:hypothetical protein
MSSHVFVVFAVFRGNQRANRRKTHNKACNWSIKDSNKFIISVEKQMTYIIIAVMTLYSVTWVTSLWIYWVSDHWHSESSLRNIKHEKGKKKFIKAVTTYF